MSEKLLLKKTIKMILNKQNILVIILFLTSWSGRAQNDTISIYFANAKSEISHKHKKTISSTFDNLDIDFEYKIQIIGWTDNKGSDSENEILSIERAFNVYNYIKDTVKLESLSSLKYEGGGKMSSFISDENKRQAMIIISKQRIEVAEKMAYLDELKIGESAPIENFIFEPGKNHLKKESIPHLLDLFKYLDNNKSMKIRLEGHVWAFYVGDTLEEKDKAQLLSEKRAENIYNFLVRKGITPDRLSYIGFGIKKPLPLTTRDPSKNRRVEIRVLEK